MTIMMMMNWLLFLFLSESSSFVSVGLGGWFFFLDKTTIILCFSSGFFFTRDIGKHGF